MISIIIPTLNEEENIRETLTHLAHYPECEVIVVDGGSSDKTVQVVQSLINVKAYTSLPCRALQMNIGAKEAQGETYLFLHADTILPDDFRDHVKKNLNKPGVLAGAFRLTINNKGVGVRIVEKVANLRARFLKLPYGDQAFFISKENFIKYGGFGDVEFLEDLILVRRLQRYGKIALAAASVKTSGRRWREAGVFKTTFLNQVIVAGYLLGLSIPFLKKLYGVLQKR